jgi:hypothetical protein
MAAAAATAEFLIVHFRKWLQRIDDVGLTHGFKSRVTSETSCEWSDKSKKIKTANDFNGLFARILRPREVTGGDDRMHEQTPIPGEKRPVFGFHKAE